LTAVLHINKSNAAGNSKRLYTSDLNQLIKIELLTSSFL